MNFRKTFGGWEFSIWVDTSDTDYGSYHITPLDDACPQDVRDAYLAELRQQFLALFRQSSNGEDT